MGYFLLIPSLLKRGAGFWPALAAGCALTIVLNLAMSVMLARFGYRI